MRRRLSYCPADQAPYGAHNGLSACGYTGAHAAGAIQAHPTERGRLVQKLRAQGGRHLVFVDYSENWDSGHEWVYNGADLDASPVIFAHLLSLRENRDLLNHFPGRKM